MKDLAGLMQQAQEMQAKIKAAQDALAQMEITGEAGGGMVSVTLNGKGEARNVHLDPALLDKADDAANAAVLLEDLVLAAINDARRKVDAQAKEQMAQMAGPLAGMMPDGFKL